MREMTMAATTAQTTIMERKVWTRIIMMVRTLMIMITLHKNNHTSPSRLRGAPRTASAYREWTQILLRVGKIRKTLKEAQASNIQVAWIREEMKDLLWTLESNLSNQTKMIRAKHLGAHRMTMAPRNTTSMVRTQVVTQKPIENLAVCGCGT